MGTGRMRHDGWRRDLRLAMERTRERNRVRECSPTSSCLRASSLNGMRGRMNRLQEVHFVRASSAGSGAGRWSPFPSPSGSEPMIQKGE